MPNPSENIFFGVLDDIKNYLDDLTLVGGWLPYIYTKFLWNNPASKLVTTVDIDFGFGQSNPKGHTKTIFEALSGSNYSERHSKIGKIYPVVLYKEGKVPIDFITSQNTPDSIIKNLLGRELSVNKLAKFNFLLNHRIPIVVKQHQKSIFKIFCPKPSAFLYHKGVTFLDREDKQKEAKDLHYMYFILRYAPNIDAILEEITHYNKEKFLENIKDGLDRYFERKTSPGCLMIEKENGSDEYVDDLRQDIFERFRQLREIL